MNRRFTSKTQAMNTRKHSWVCLKCDAVHLEKKKGHKLICHCGSHELQYFPSGAELRRYRSLQLMQRCGNIYGLELQPSYNVVINGHEVTTYRADFRYYDDKGVLIIEDVKGTTNEKYHDPVFKLKRKLVEAVFGIKITIT